MFCFADFECCVFWVLMGTMGHNCKNDGGVRYEAAMVVVVRVCDGRRPSRMMKVLTK
jgi:hypothetical protein